MITYPCPKPIFLTSKCLIYVKNKEYGNIYMLVVDKIFRNVSFLQATVMEAKTTTTIHYITLKPNSFFSLRKIKETGNDVRVWMNNDIHMEPYEVVINPCPDFLDSLTTASF